MGIDIPHMYGYRYPILINPYIRQRTFTIYATHTTYITFLKYIIYMKISP